MHSSKNESKETTAVSILSEDPTREVVTTGKIFQGDSLWSPKNGSQQKMSQPFQQKVDYEDDTKKEL